MIVYHVIFSLEIRINCSHVPPVINVHDTTRQLMLPGKLRKECIFKLKFPGNQVLISSLNQPVIEYVESCIDKRRYFDILLRGKEGEVYNIGNDSETSIADLAKIVRKLVESSSKIYFKDLPENDPKRRAADITKMRELGWGPKISLEEGIRNIVKYNQGN